MPPTSTDARSPLPAPEGPNFVVPLDEGETGGADHLDALFAFPSEAASPRATPTLPPGRVFSIPPDPAPPVEAPERPQGARTGIVLLLAALAVVEAPFAAMWIREQTVVSTVGPALPAKANGAVIVETDPVGAEVWVNGAARGRTPLRLSLARGPAEIELRYDGGVRILPLTVVPEETVRLRVELPAASQSAAAWTRPILSPVTLDAD